MGINPLRRICMENQQQKEKNNHYEILTQDYQKFSKQKWYMFQNPILFDPKKFIFLCSNYQQEQEDLINRWKATIPDIKNIQYGQSRIEEDVNSPRWKYAVRRGVPIQYYKIMISVFFNKNFTNLKLHYDKLKSQINFSEPLPLFGLQQTTIKQGIVMPFLNDKGYAVLRQLMYLFKRKKGQFFENKYIGYIASLLLIFFQDYQAYDLISTMMDQSSNMSITRQEGLRWQIVFKEQQIKNLAANFFRIVSKNSQKIAKMQSHFDNYKIDKIKLFIRVIQRFFIQFLPFPFILRIFILFLNEGIKIFYRIFYTMIVYSYKQLLESFSFQKSIQSLKKKCLNISYEQTKELIKNGFNLNLKATISTKLYENRLQKQNDQRKYYYLPFIKGESHILSYLDLETIWSFLPFQFKSYDLERRYPQNTEIQKQRKLQDLLRSFQSSKYNLFVIKTKTNHVFGFFFIANNIHQLKQKWIGNNQTFVFTLYPKVNKYESTRQNNQYIHYNNHMLLVGSGGLGSAITIKQNLLEGQSYKCHTFRNEPLNDVSGAFQIQTIEVFILF